MKRLFALLAVLLLAAPASAASQVEALRSQAQAARASVNEARSQQMAKTLELNRLSAHIEELKAKAKGRLLPGSELDSALKQSQELSGVLTTLAQTVSGRQAELEQANLALLTAVTEQMKGLRADFDRATTHEARSALIAQMKALKAEREQVRAGLPAAKVPALAELKDSDDPTELLEQADQVRDDEDKVRAQLKALDARISEAKAERDLDSRMRDFVSEDNLFDEHDRRLRVRHESFENAPAAAGGSDTQQTGAFNGPAPQTPSSPVPVPPARTTVGASPPPTTNFGGGSALDTAQSPGGASGSSADQVPNTSSGSNYSDQPSQGLIRHVTEGSDARPAVGAVKGNGGDDDDDLDELEVQRMRLKSLADQLKAKAAQLQQKASQLR
jgi:hypothetical protein